MSVYIFLIVTGLFICLISSFAAFLILKIVTLSKKNDEITSYIKFATEKINEARYGNFRIKFNKKEDPLNLYKSLNNLFESIYDRDLVITEYREKEKENYNLKEEFIAALTHDLKVPIIAQDKTCDLLLDKKFGELNEIQKEVILKLKDSNTDLKDMVQSMLETYKLEHTGINPDIKKEINVETFLKECIGNFETLCYANGIKINLQVQESNIKGDFDPFLIKRVVNNLISNAINHSKSSDKINVHLAKTGDTFSIDIIDFGDGIEEEEILNIFKKYYSLTNKTSRVSTGLGLYLSNKIIKSHKGIIEVESKKGEGSIFRIILPIKI